MPVPALPAMSCTPALFRVITFVASVILTVGVRVAVQVIPPSPVVTVPMLPLAIVKSLEVRPVTASLKVMVTREVSPTFNAVSATTILAVGNTPSTTRAAPALREPEAPGVGRVRIASTKVPL